jgi:hypothetical protein
MVFFHATFHYLAPVIYYLSSPNESLIVNSRLARSSFAVYKTITPI